MLLLQTETLFWSYKMNLSIKKIFTSVTTLMTLFILILAFISLIMLGEHNSQKQITLLQKHYSEIKEIKSINTEDETLRMIEFQSISAKLTHNIQDYKATFDAFEPLKFISSSDRDIENFKNFRDTTDKFIQNAKEYIKDISSHTKESKFNKNYNQLSQIIVDMLNQRITAEHRQFSIRESITYASVIIGLIFLLIMHRQLNVALRDIQSLYGVTDKENPYEIKTLEVQAIATKFKKDSLYSSNNPQYIDELTQIKNYKGMLHAYNTTKAIKEHKAPAICLFEIDHYDIIKSRYGKEFSELIRKKIAFMITLHEQPVDIIATIEESKFILILARNSKKEALDECEKIKQSIAETYFKVPQGDKFTVTVSGAFIIKPTNKSLDISISHAKDILKKAQNNGTNTIAQLKDYAERF